MGKIFQRRQSQLFTDCHVQESLDEILEKYRLFRFLLFFIFFLVNSLLFFQIQFLLKFKAHYFLHKIIFKHSFGLKPPPWPPPVIWESSYRLASFARRLARSSQQRASEERASEPVSAAAAVRVRYSFRCDGGAHVQCLLQSCAACSLACWLVCIEFMKKKKGKSLWLSFCGLLDDQWVKGQELLFFCH